MGARWINNIENLINEKNIKIGDFEKRIGVSAGYISRLKARSDNGEDVNPTVTILNSMSHVLGVSMDMLINYDIPPSHDNLTTLTRVLDKLITDTDDKKIHWDIFSKEKLKYEGDCLSWSLFKREIVENEDNPKPPRGIDEDDYNPGDYTRNADECTYKSKFGSGIEINGTAYSVRIDAFTFFHIIEVRNCIGNGWEVYMENIDGRIQLEGLFTTLEEPTNMLVDKVEDLIKCIKRNRRDAIIGSNLKKMLDDYMKK